eukprot:220929_1
MLYVLPYSFLKIETSVKMIAVPSINARGDRVNHNFIDCVKSVFQWHNETANIWTEFFFVLLLPLSVYYGLFKISWTFNISLAIIHIRPITSGSAHLLHPISPKWSRLMWKADYVSIELATVASNINYNACMLCCNPEAFSNAITHMIFIALILIIVILHLNEKTQHIMVEMLLSLLLGFAYFGMFIKGIIYNNSDWKNENYHWVNFHNFWFYSVFASVIAIIFRIIDLMNKSDSHRCSHRCTASHAFWHTLINVSVFWQLYSWKEFHLFKTTVENHCN